jgi:uncharacterized protein YwgA
MNQKLSKGNHALQPVQQPLEAIENLILNIRGKQVMLDRDLARLYGVETKRLNEAVKRNIERFPERFMFQLAEDEKNKVVAICDHLKELRFSYQKPYAFTEQGVSMLSAVLKSETAINISIKIMDAFVAMRHALLENHQLFNRIESLEYHHLLMIERQKTADSQIETIFKALSKYELPKENIFYNNQVYDAHILMTNFIKQAKNRIVVIDNYVDDSVLTLLSKRKTGVSAEIYTYKVSQQFSLDLARHHTQYPQVTVHVNKSCHDRFLIIDDQVYHIGASVKDLGQKLCAVTLLNSISATEILNKLI